MSGSALLLLPSLPVANNVHNSRVYCSEAVSNTNNGLHTADLAATAILQNYSRPRPRLATDCPASRTGTAATATQRRRRATRTKAHGPCYVPCFSNRSLKAIRSVVRGIVLRCVVCWWMYVGASAVMFKVLHETGHFLTHAAADHQKKTFSGFWKNVEAAPGKPSEPPTVREAQTSSTVIRIPQDVFHRSQNDPSRRKNKREEKMKKKI